MKSIVITHFIICFTVISPGAQIPFSQCQCGSFADNLFFRIEHHHKIENHSEFGEKEVINQVCSSTEFVSEINVVADGTASSILEIVRESCSFPENNADPFNLIILDENFEEIGNSNPMEYGMFERISQSGSKSYWKYTHPKVGPDPGMVSKSIYVKIGYPNLHLSNLIVNVFNVPVVMVHGLWSNSGAFDPMKNQLLGSGEYMDYQLHSANYESTNDRSFSSNSDVIPNGIRDLINACKENMLAAGKVNVVCHSMGGVLTRLYMKSPTFESNNDIYRTITCNTPHAGSQMANFLLDNSQYGNVISSTLALAGMNSYAGAVSDLRVGYPEINEVESASILGDAKVHAILTVTDPLSSPILSFFQNMTSVSVVMALMLKHCGGAFLEDIFDEDFHDGIVARDSQKGGLVTIYTSDISNQVHMGSVENSVVMAKVKEMLSEPFTTSLFSITYGSVNISYTFNAPCLPFSGRESADDRITADVEFITPTSGINAIGGDSLTIKYSYSMVDSILITLATHPDSLAVMFTIASGDSLLFPTPARLYGPHRMVLMGLDQEGSILDQDSVTINFITNATLDSILISPGAFYLNQQDSAEFSMNGLFSDGVIRNLMFEDSMNFDFDFDRASRRSTYFIRMDSLASDTLVVSKNGAMSHKVIIHKSGTNFPANCKTVVNTLPDGSGSLKQALACANNGDTIVFDIALLLDTIEVDTHGLILDKSISLINSHGNKIYIKSAALAVFNTFAGYNIHLENLGIIAEHANAVVITNFGNLTLKNVDCRNLTSGVPAKLLNNDGGEVTMLGDVKF